MPVPADYNLYDSVQFSSSSKPAFNMHYQCSLSCEWLTMLVSVIYLLCDGRLYPPYLEVRHLLFLYMVHGHQTTCYCGACPNKHYHNSNSLTCTYHFGGNESRKHAQLGQSVQGSIHNMRNRSPMTLTLL